MKRNKNSSSSLQLVIVFLIIVFTAFSTIICVEARKNHNKKSSKPHHKHHKQKSSGCGNSPHGSSSFPNHAPSHHFDTCPNRSNIFNLFSFGAKGDGVYDDSKALQAAWKAACKVQWATVKIPSEFKFLIKPITLQGPCMPYLVIQIDGTLLAPPKIGSWPKSSLFQWLNFKWVQNFTILGTGTFDGQGSNWWKPSQIHYIQKRSKNIPNIKPTAMRFYASYNVAIRDIKIINSPQCHLKFDNSRQVKVDNITITSPESSPNTDGIHLQNTQDVEIQHSKIGCGDDCVSIQTGCTNVHVHHINCGPGHGISLGGLGKDRSIIACVSNIVVDNISMKNTLYGVRIKTWQGGIGSVKNVSFSNIQVTDVKIPIMIDQYYCDKKKCKNETESVTISGVKYDRIIGTYSVQPIHLACSYEIPCTSVDLINIQLESSTIRRGLFRRGFEKQPTLCWNSYGKTQGPLVPSSIDYCLRSEDGVRRTRRTHDHNICL